MAKMPLPSQDVLCHLFSYDPDTGILTRKANVSKKSHSKIDALAFTTNDCGYFKGRIANKLFKAHRVIWKMMTGEDPDVIDHIDGNGLNNKWANLRNTSHTGNMRNMASYASNTSGCVGVSLSRRERKWRAYIGGSRTGRKYLGFFENFDDAVLARTQAQKSLGYSERHGKSSADHILSLDGAKGGE